MEGECVPAQSALNLSWGIYVGVVIGIIVLAIVAALIVKYIVNKRRESKNKSTSANGHYQINKSPVKSTSGKHKF